MLILKTIKTKILMELKLNFKPVATLTDTNYSKLITKIEEHNCFAYRQTGIYYANLICNEQGSNAIVYNIQKFNKKVVQERDEHNLYVSSTIVREKYFIMQVYQIPIKLLKLANVAVIQEANNFHFESLSKKK